MSIDWVTLFKGINFPQVIVSLVLGSILTYFIQRCLQKRPQKREFNFTVTKPRSGTDGTGERMQFTVGARGDIDNVDIIVEEDKSAEVS